MSYNGSGVWTANSVGLPVVTGTTISSTMFNAFTADVATGFSTAVCKDGQQTCTARVPFAQGLSSFGINIDGSGGSSAVGFIQSGSGAVANTLQGKGRESVSILDFCSPTQRTSALAWDFSVDCADAWQAAINFACTFPGGADIDLAHCGYRLESELDLTSNVTGEACSLHIKGNAGQPGTGVAQVLFVHTGNGFDCTGSPGLTFSNLSFEGDNSTSPATAFLLARTDTGHSAGRHRFFNCQGYGKFTKGAWYSYGSEENEYIACYGQNLYTAAAGRVVCITANNAFSATSSFATIATGAQSNITGNFFGGSFYMNSSHASADVFYLEGAGQFRWFGTWMYCGTNAANGRSGVYIDLTTATSDNLLFSGCTWENSTFKQNYGLLFSDTARTPTGIAVRDCRMSTATRAIYAPTNVTLDALNVENLSEVSSAGIEVVGTLQKSEISGHDRTLVIGTSNNNSLNGNASNWTITNTGGTDVRLDTNTGVVMDKGRSVGMGVWTTPAYDTGNFGANGTMTWGVASGDVTNYQYMMVGKSMFVIFQIDNSDVGGSPNTELRLKVPAAKTVAKSAGGACFSNDNGGGYVASTCVATAGTTYIAIYKNPSFAAWTASTNATSVFGQVTFEIQ